jgi:hypothetical protein
MKIAERASPWKDQFPAYCSSSRGADAKGVRAAVEDLG